MEWGLKKWSKRKTQRFTVVKEKGNRYERRRQKGKKEQNKTKERKKTSPPLLLWLPPSCLLPQFLCLLVSVSSFSCPACFPDALPFLLLPSSSMSSCLVFQTCNIAGLCVSFPSSVYKSTDSEVSRVGLNPSSATCLTVWPWAEPNLQAPVAPSVKWGC